MRAIWYVKSDIAVAKVTLKLLENGFNVLSPVAGEQHRFDLVAHERATDKFYKIQVKYIGGLRKKLRPGTSYNKCGKGLSYVLGDFDKYAAYIPEKDAVAFFPFNCKGREVLINEPTRVGVKYLWWEDYLNFHSPEKTRVVLSKKPYKERIFKNGLDKYCPFSYNIGR